MSVIHSVNSALLVLKSQLTKMAIVIVCLVGLRIVLAVGMVNAQAVLMGIILINQIELACVAQIDAKFVWMLIHVKCVVGEPIVKLQQK